MIPHLPAHSQPMGMCRLQQMPAAPVLISLLSRFALIPQICLEVSKLLLLPNEQLMSLTGGQLGSQAR